MKEGSKEIQDELDKVEDKAKKRDIKVGWSEDERKKAEENINRILEKKKQLAKEETISVAAPDVSREADFDWEKNARESARINAELEKAVSAAGGLSDGAEEADVHFNALRVDVEEYAKTLLELESQEKYFGDADYDEVYLAWRNAKDAVKQYAAELDKQTESGRAQEAAIAAKEAEREEKVKAQEAAERELQEIRQSAVVSNQNLVYLLQEQERITQRMALLKKAGVADGYEEYDSLKGQLALVNEEIENTREGFNQVKKSGEKAFSVIQNGSKKTSGLLGTLSSRLKGIALSMLVFNWITKGFNAMVSAMKEGFQNLAQYSSDYNKSMSELKSSTAQLKNGLAAAFEPIANMVIPYLTQLVGWLNTAVDAMSRFLAALQGKSTYTRAKKQVIDYAKSLNTATDAAKGALASFDQLNVLNKSSGASTVTAGGELTGADAFEMAEIGTEISNFAGEIMEAIQPFREAISNWWQDIDFEPLTTAFNNLKEACEPFGDYLYDGLLWFLTDILLPLGTWTIESALPAFLYMLAEGASSLDTVLRKIRPSLDYIWEKVLVPISNFTGEVFLWAIDLIKDAFSELSELFETKGDSINNILDAVGKAMELLWGGVAKPTIQFLMGAISTFVKYIFDIAGDVIDILSGIIDFVVGVFTGDWEKAWNGIKDVFKGIVNLIADIVEGLVNMIISGLNNISIDVPEWVPIIGGEHFGFDFSPVSIPRLADGAVIQGGRPFAAILGDQRFGQTNIETPLPTMVAAFKQALAESGGVGGEYTFIAQLNGRTLFNEMVKQNRMYKKTTGYSAF